MTVYYIYASLGPKQNWTLQRNEKDKPIVLLTSEIASLTMMRLKQENPSSDFMFYPLQQVIEPQETLRRNCGCGGKNR